jgi:hypothetical protein
MVLVPVFRRIAAQGQKPARESETRGWPAGLRFSPKMGELQMDWLSPEDLKEEKVVTASLRRAPDISLVPRSQTPSSVWKITRSMMPEIPRPRVLIAAFIRWGIHFPMEGCAVVTHAGGRFYGDLAAGRGNGRLSRLIGAEPFWARLAGI